MKAVFAAALFAASALALATPQTALAQGQAPVAAADSAIAMAYGPHALQAMNYYPAKGTWDRARPAIIFIHGGAWVGGDMSDSTGSAKIRHYPEQGYHLFSVNYRLVPEVAIGDQARDVAAAVRAVVDSAEANGIDTSRIVLMGHSAGGHLASLVATDHRYLEKHDLSPDMIAGVVSIDSAALDVPLQVEDAGLLAGMMFRIAFGNEPNVQQALSPAHHVGGRDARDFLLLHVERREAQRQAESFAKLLQKDGTRVRVEAFEGRGMDGHNAINSRLGRADYKATGVVDDWLASVFAL